MSWSWSTAALPDDSEPLGAENPAAAEAENRHTLTLPCFAAGKLSLIPCPLSASHLISSP
jgi:hypothetical protein